jgi:hypothetical protein
LKEERSKANEGDEVVTHYAAVNLIAYHRAEEEDEKKGKNGLEMT